MDRLDVFKTPIHVIKLDGLDAVHAALRPALIAESNATAGVSRSNVGGWHSPPDLTQRTGEYVPLMRRLAAELNRVVHAQAIEAGITAQFQCGYALQAWAMVLPPGGYVMPHDHADAHFSGVYYLDAGEAPSAPDLAGRIAFVNPLGGGGRIPGLDLSPSNLTIRPQTGMLLIFPGYLPHYVHPYRGKRPRVAVSFNARVRLEAMDPPS